MELERGREGGRESGMEESKEGRREGRWIRGSEEVDQRGWQVYDDIMLCV